MITLLFFSRSDRHSTTILTDIFGPRDGYVWFIEEIKSNKWLAENNKLTNDPHKAKQFPTQPQAISYQIQNNLSQKEFTQTEHQFIDNSCNCNESDCNDCGR